MNIVAADKSAAKKTATASCKDSKAETRLIQTGDNENKAVDKSNLVAAAIAAVVNKERTKLNEVLMSWCDFSGARDSIQHAKNTSGE